MENELILKSADLYKSQSLDKLAELINRGHEEVHLHVRRTALEVAQVGSWLTAAKGKCVHGSWLPWLEKKCAGVTDRTAQNYMRIYKKCVSNTKLISDLRPTQAYKMLGIVKDSPDSVHFSSATSEWTTPSDIIENVLAVLGVIDVDPCSDEANTVPASLHFHERENGLEELWKGRIYMNPPYGNVIQSWVEKLIAEYECGNVAEAMALVPARTDTDWFRMLWLFPICFIYHRLKFGDGENSAPFPSCMAYLGKNVDRFKEVFQFVGQCEQPL